MTDQLMIPWAPPAYSLDDNGSVFWPPECHFVDFPDEWPFVAESWQKYGSVEEHRKILRFRESVRCTTKIRVFAVAPVMVVDEIDLVVGRVRWRRDVIVQDRPCGMVLDSWRAAPIHQQQCHPGQACTFDYVNLRWVWDALGFDDHFMGKPMGWRTVLDGRNPSNHRWEYDYSELGPEVADHFWRNLDGEQAMNDWLLR